MSFGPPIPAKAVVIGAGRVPAPAGPAIPEYRAGIDTEPQRRCRCFRSRGVWLDRASNLRCELCNLKIRDWEMIENA